MHDSTLHDPFLGDAWDHTQRGSNGGAIVERLSAPAETVDLIVNLVVEIDDLQRKVESLQDLMDAQIAINREVESENLRLWGALGKAQKGLG